MTLTQYMAQRGELPLETNLIVRRGGQSQEYRSTHAISGISESDREKINQVRGMLTLYREVALKDFP